MSGRAARPAKSRDRNLILLDNWDRRTHTEDREGKRKGRRRTIVARQVRGTMLRSLLVFATLGLTASSFAASINPGGDVTIDGILGAVIVDPSNRVIGLDVRKDPDEPYALLLDDYGSVIELGDVIPESAPFGNLVLFAFEFGPPPPPIRGAVRLLFDTTSALWDGVNFHAFATGSLVSGRLSPETSQFIGPPTRYSFDVISTTPSGANLLITGQMTSGVTNYVPEPGTGTLISGALVCVLAVRSFSKR